VRVSFLAFFALGLFGCGVQRVRMPVTGGRKATAGCYRLSFRPWEPAFSSEQTAHLGSLTPPSPIQLRSNGDVAPRWAFLGTGFNSLLGSWELRRPDSLIVIWDAGEMWIEMRLTPLADSLSGYTTILFAHMGDSEPAPSAAVSMVPVSCS